MDAMSLMLLLVVVFVLLKISPPAISNIMKIFTIGGFWRDHAFGVCSFYSWKSLLLLTHNGDSWIIRCIAVPK